MDTATGWFQSMATEETGLTLIANHEAAIQSGPLQRQPLMQVNHILNILISSGEEGEGGRMRSGEFVPRVS